MKLKINLVLLVVMLLSVVLAFSGCGRDPFEQGSFSEISINDKREATLGSANKNGWEVTIPPGTFAEGSAVSMDVYSEEDAKELENEKFAFIGSPIELWADNYYGEPIGTPVTLTLKIPDDMVDDETNLQSFCAVYYNDDKEEWIYYTPDSIDVKARTMTVTISHFSLWGAAKLSEEEQVEKFLDDYSKNVMMKERQDEDLRELFEEGLKNQLDYLGVRSETARNQLVRDMINYVDKTETGLAGYINSAWSAVENDDPYIFYNGCAEFLTTNLAGILEKDKNAFAKFEDKSIMWSGSIATALGYATEGDMKGAAEAIAGQLKNYTPGVALMTSMADYAKDKVLEELEIWKYNQMEDLYEIYRDGLSTSRHDVRTGDFDELWEYIDYGFGVQTSKAMGRFFTSDAMKKYCEKFGWDAGKYDQLSDAQKEMLKGRAKEDLRKKFEERAANDWYLQEIKDKEREFIRQCMEERLLNSTSYRNAFGENNSTEFSVPGRLSRIYRMRALIADLVDEEKMEELGYNYADLIRDWLFHHEDYNAVEAKKKFAEYLKRIGLLKEGIYGGNDLVWVLTDTINHEYAQQVADFNKEFEGAWDLSISGSGTTYTLKSTFIGPDYTGTDGRKILNGEHYTCTFTTSAPPSIMGQGELVSLPYNAAIGDHMLNWFDCLWEPQIKFDYHEVKPGFVSAEAYEFESVDRDSEGNPIALRCYLTGIYWDKSGEVDSISTTVTANAPGIYEEGEKTGIHISRIGYGAGTSYIYTAKPLGKVAQ